MGKKYIEDCGGIKPVNMYEKPLGMAWYKYLIYFALIAGAVLNFIYSVTYLTGSIYVTETDGAVTTEQVYAYYDSGLQAVDMMYGILLIGYGIFAIVLRNKLAHYEPDAPKLVTIFYSISAIAPLLYAILTSVITKLPIGAQAISSLIAHLILLFANRKYFNKRAHLFIDKAETVVNVVHTPPPPVINNSTSPAAEIITDTETEPQKVLFCRICGAKLVDGSTFCHKCGTSIDSDTFGYVAESELDDIVSTIDPELLTPESSITVEPASQEPEQAAHSNAASKKKHTFPLLIGSIACLVVAGILCLVFFGANKVIPKSAEEIYQLVSPSVVEITAETRTGTSLGSGFFLDANGTIVTNYHVIESSTSAKITLSNGQSYTVVKVLGYSEEKDIAILSTTCTNSVPLTIRDSEIKTGEKIYAIGNTLGFLERTLSDGIVSAASREFDEGAYIQFTAPVSQGNSGGPLLDEWGQVIGIVTWARTDGQNINFATPIFEVDSISTMYPTTLSELFKPEVEWISECEFSYYSDLDRFVLVFELADEDKIAMSSNGTAKIRIINSEGVTVYNQSRVFQESNLEEWTYNGSIKKLLTTIYINPNDITPGISSEGKIYFTVYGEDYYFDELSLDVDDLPVKPVTVQLPSLPMIVTKYWSYGVWTQTRINTITYDIVNGDSIYFYFSGEKLYDESGNNGTNSCSFGWKLYDSEGYLIDSGTVYSSGLSVGDKFKDETGYVFDKIKPGETYRLVLVDIQ